MPPNELDRAAHQFALAGLRQRLRRYQTGRDADSGTVPDVEALAGLMNDDAVRPLIEVEAASIVLELVSGELLDE